MEDDDARGAGGLEGIHPQAEAKIDHLRDLAMDAFTTRDEVQQLETHLIFQHSRKPALPLYREAD